MIFLFFNLSFVFFMIFFFFFISSSLLFSSLLSSLFSPSPSPLSSLLLSCLSSYMSLFLFLFFFFSFLFSPSSSLSSSLSLSFTAHTKTRSTRQVTPPTKNGHAPRSIESRESYHTFNVLSAPSLAIVGTNHSPKVLLKMSSRHGLWLRRRRLMSSTLLTFVRDQWQHPW